MRRIAFLAAAIIFITGASYASDYQGNEKQESIFQKLGDLITGKYEVKKGETLKEVGVVQVIADQVKEIKSGPVR
jgi:hypothetical protein